MKGIDKNGEEIDEQNGDEEAAESDEEEEQQWISETSLLTNFQHDLGIAARRGSFQQNREGDELLCLPKVS